MRYLLSLILILLSCNNNTTVTGRVNDNRMQSFIPKDSGTSYFSYDTTSAADRIFGTLAANALFSSKEPVLSTYSGEGEFIRWTWLSPFGDPMVIRISKFNDTVYANFKELVLESVGERKRVVAKDSIVTLNKHKWNELVMPINRSDFWSAPYSDTARGKDGVVWILECRVNGRYKVIQRWSDGVQSLQAVRGYLKPLTDFINGNVHQENK